MANNIKRMISEKGMVLEKIFKKSTEIFRKRFFYSRNLIRPAIVDRLIGADFDAPQNLKNLMSNNPHLKNASSVLFSEDHNVLQFWEDNDIKQNIDNGFVPLDLTEEEQQELLKTFETQLAFDDELF